MRPSSVFRHISLVLAVLLSVCTPGYGQRTLTDLKVFPAEISLTTDQDRQSLVVQAFYDDGITKDVTEQANMKLADAGVATRQGYLIKPTADGKTKLHVAFGGRSLSVPVEVKDAKTTRAISFKLDVMPVFAKAGCNSGSCHGAARGKDGFRLSLFGFDPEGDYYRVTREISGRRINLALPRESLLLTNATGMTSHSGGQRFEEDSELYNMVLRWLQKGAPQDPAELPQAVGIELYPQSAVLNGPQARQRLSVRARYSDKTTRDVTHLAYFMTNNATSAEVSQEGFITAGERGEAYVTARFDAFTVGMPVVVLPKDLKFQWPQVTAHNYIDELVFAKLKKLRIKPSGLCSDEVFLRRACLDIIGKLPTPEETRRFLSDRSPQKREHLIDELLSRKEFVEVWVMKWAELLQIKSSQRVSYKAALLYYNWLSEQIANDVPMDQMVQELLGASGGTFAKPPTNYYQNERDVLKTSENVAQVFMGMRIQCAQCHNHPFDRWTMDDYYGFAAFFSQIGRKNAEDPRETIVYNRRSGEVRHPVTKQNTPPKFLGGEVPDVKGKDRRKVLAQWLASDDNPYFAKNLANIVWAHFLGRGIIEPVDDVRVTNPAVNGELLDALGKRFSEYDYDFKRLVRDICTSRTYQLATQTNETNERDHTNFSHASLRRIRAEVLLDCLSQVTESPNKFRGLPLGARAVQIADGRTTNYFLTTFGRASRETVCSCEVKMEPNLSQALHLINGSTVAGSIRRGKVINKLLEQDLTPEQIVDDLYLRTLCRKPTEQELSVLLDVLSESDNVRQSLEDIFWALLNSREFLFNH